MGIVVVTHLASEEHPYRLTPSGGYLNGYDVPSMSEENLSRLLFGTAAAEVPPLETWKVVYIKPAICAMGDGVTGYLHGDWLVFSIGRPGYVVMRTDALPHTGPGGLQRSELAALAAGRYIEED